MLTRRQLFKYVAVIAVALAVAKLAKSFGIAEPAEGLGDLRYQ